MMLKLDYFLWKTALFSTLALSSFSTIAGQHKYIIIIKGSSMTLPRSTSVMKLAVQTELPKKRRMAQVLKCENLPFRSYRICP